MANRLKMAMLESILTFHRLGWSNRRIARELGIDRDAVSRHLRTVAARSKAATAPPGSEEAAPRSNAAKAPPGSGAAGTEANAAKAPTGSEAATEPALACPSRSLCEAWHAVIRAKVEAG